MQAIASKHKLPKEIIIHIYGFVNMKPQYNEVLHELELKYNMGLWWLSTPPKYIFNKLEQALADPWDEHLYYLYRDPFGNAFLPDKQLFTTYNDDNYTCYIILIDLLYPSHISIRGIKELLEVTRDHCGMITCFLVMYFLVLQSFNSSFIVASCGEILDLRCLFLGGI